MFEFYSKEQFDALKMYNLNADQIVQLINCSAFVPLYEGANVKGIRPEPVARKEKVIEALNFLMKSRKFRQFDKRQDVVNAIRYIALDHSILANLKQQSYVTTLIHTMAKMRMKDAQSWLSLASYFSQRYEFFDIRSISNIMYSFYKITSGNLRSG